MARRRPAAAPSVSSCEHADEEIRQVRDAGRVEEVLVAWMLPQSVGNSREMVRTDASKVCMRPRGGLLRWIASTKRLRKTRTDPTVVCGHAYSISVRELLHRAWVFSADSMARFFSSVLTRKGRFATRHIFEASADLRKRVISSAKGDDDKPWARAECEQILLSGPHISFMSPSTRHHACQSDNHDRYQKSFLVLPHSHSVAASWSASLGRLRGRDER
jgi:hypothetical protein